MDSGRFLFGPSSCHGNMFFLGNSNGDSIFQGARSLMSMDENSKIRPFFSSSEELYEDYYDDQMPEKKRRLTPEQVHLLEKSFEAENKLEPERKSQLSKNLGLQPRQVAVWFQNRRARWKTKQLERDYDALKASYDSLRSNYDSIVMENEMLRSEINSLNEKLRSKEATGASTNGQTNDAVQQAEEAAGSAPHQFNTKVEDRVSSRSGGSAVLNEDGPQLVDSGDSYFEADDYPGCVGGRSEEDDGSDDTGSYLSGVFAASEQPHQEEGVAFGWLW